MNFSSIDVSPGDIRKSEFASNLRKSLTWGDDLPERLPLSDVTDLITPSTNSTAPTIKKYTIEYRKRAYEEEFIILNKTPPDSMRLRPDVLCNQQTPGIFKYRRRISDQPTIDYFKEYPIPIEVVRKMFSFLNKKDMSSAMQACKFFYNAGATCDNWDFIDFHNRNMFDTRIMTILQRKVRVCRMSDCRISSIPNEPLERCLESDGEPINFQLTHLDLGRTEFLRIEALSLILSACTHLKGLSLEGIDFKETGTEIGKYIGQNKKLRYLDFSLTKGLAVEGYEHIVTGCRLLNELNLSWCGLDEESVKILVKKLPITLKKLNLSGTLDKMSIQDQDVIELAETCPKLEELDLSDNISLGNGCVETLTKLGLHTLSLNRCYSINTNNFLVLNVFGTMTDQGLKDLNYRMRHTKVNAEVLSFIAKPTIPPSVSSIWQQRTRDIY